MIKCKVHDMVFEEEKFADFESIYFENSSLTWLHKVSPAFPVNGSQVCTLIIKNYSFFK